jgi:hypothetical protein
LKKSGKKKKKNKKKKKKKKKKEKKKKRSEDFADGVEIFFGIRRSDVRVQSPRDKLKYP